MYDLAKPKDVQPEEEEVHEEQEPVIPPKPKVHEKPENNTNYFENDYKNKEPVKEKPKEEPKEEPEQPEYKQEYEAKIDQIGGFVRMPSRRDRLNFKNFNI